MLIFSVHFAHVSLSYYSLHICLFGCAWISFTFPFLAITNHLRLRHPPSQSIWIVSPSHICELSNTPNSALYTYQKKKIQWLIFLMLYIANNGCDTAWQKKIKKKSRTFMLPCLNILAEHSIKPKMNCSHVTIIYRPLHAKRGREREKIRYFSMEKFKQWMFAYECAIELFSNWPEYSVLVTVERRTIMLFFFFFLCIRTK